MLIFMPHFKIINFYRNRPKIKLFAKPYEILECLERSSQAPEHSPPIAVSGYTTYCKRVLLRFQVL